jgi:hypothetical protein
MIQCQLSKCRTALVNGGYVSGFDHSKWNRQYQTLSPEFSGTSSQKSLRLSHRFCGGIAGGILVSAQRNSAIFQYFKCSLNVPPPLPSFMSICVRMGPLGSDGLAETGRNPRFCPTFASAYLRLVPYAASSGVGVFWGYLGAIRNLPIPPAQLSRLGEKNT